MEARGRRKEEKISLLVVFVPMSVIFSGNALAPEKNISRSNYLRGYPFISMPKFSDTPLTEEQLISVDCYYLIITAVYSWPVERSSFCNQPPTPTKLSLWTCSQRGRKIMPQNEPTSATKKWWAKRAKWDGRTYTRLLLLPIRSLLKIKYVRSLNALHREWFWARWSGFLTQVWFAKNLIVLVWTGIPRMKIGWLCPASQTFIFLLLVFFSRKSVNILINLFGICVRFFDLK